MCPFGSMKDIPDSCDEKDCFLLFDLHMLSASIPKLYRTCLELVQVQSYRVLWNNNAPNQATKNKAAQTLLNWSWALVEQSKYFSRN